MKDPGSYAEGLEATKRQYPFADWHETGADMYTPEICARFAGLFDTLILNLIAAGPQAEEASKLTFFEEELAGLNQINAEDECLIETSERDELCELCDVIAAASGLNPTDYGDGEGVATKWRQW